jgi:pleiotropic regulator 1
LTSKIHDEYESLRALPEALIKQQKAAMKARSKPVTVEDVTMEEDNDSNQVQKLIDTISEKTTM